MSARFRNLRTGSSRDSSADPAKTPGTPKESSVERVSDVGTLNADRPVELIEELNTLKELSAESVPQLSALIPNIVQILEQGKMNGSNYEGLNRFTSAIAALNVYVASIDKLNALQKAKAASLRMKLLDLYGALKHGSDRNLKYFSATGPTSKFTLFITAFQGEVDVLGPLVNPALQPEGVLNIEFIEANIDTTKARAQGGDVGCENVGPQRLRMVKGIQRLGGGLFNKNQGRAK